MSTPPPSSPPSASAAAKKPQPLPWTHEETVQLILAYQEKWYKLRRGPLKSSQWEEVAVTVAARCGYDFAEQSKTSTQCRHKMEKLRQRHRTFRKRLRPGSRSGWPFFDLMETLEQGPMPISAVLPRQQLIQQEDDEYDHHYGGGDEEEEEEEENYGRVRSIEDVLRRPTMVNRFSGGRASFLGKRAREAVEDNGDVVEPPRRLPGMMTGGEMVVEVAGEIRALAKRLVGLEKMRVEMMKETERCREEMEKRRIEMIQQSQQKIVESIDKAFGLDPAIHQQQVE